MVSLKLLVAGIAAVWGLAAACSCSCADDVPDVNGNNNGGNNGRNDLGDAGGNEGEGACHDWRFPADEEPGGLMWPVGNGTTPMPLGNTYGQSLGGAEVHFGLDVQAEEGAAVYAMEDGTVEWVDTNLMNYKGLVVSSKAVPGRAFLYLHVKPLDPYLTPPVEVRARDMLGTIEYGVGAHLHLSRLGDGYTTDDWSKIDWPSVRNPLALLDPAYVGDEIAPVIHDKHKPVEPIEPLRFRSNEITYSSSLTDYSSAEIPPGPCDVLARVDDSDGRSASLHTPYFLSLSIDGEVRFTIRLDGSLAGQDMFYQRDMGDGTSLLYFELTSGEAHDPAENGAWNAVAGTHQLELCVLDVAGKVTRAEMSVTVKP